LIPVLLMLPYPPGYPLSGPTQAPPLRASDTDRDTTVDILCAAVGDGRLTLAELDERVGAALAARTCTQLAALIADLPGRRRMSPSQSLTPANGARVRSRDVSERLRRNGDQAARPGWPTRTRWSLIQSLVDRLASAPSPALAVKGSLA
jgi:hypothetical protein